MIPNQYKLPLTTISEARVVGLPGLSRLSSRREIVIYIGHVTIFIYIYTFRR